jgi:hypothetical protein
MRCWSCGSTTNFCYEGCECAKCIDPEGYEEWKNNNPDEYENWLERESEKENEEY